MNPQRPIEFLVLPIVCGKLKWLTLLEEEPLCGIENIESSTYLVEDIYTHQRMANLLRRMRIFLMMYQVIQMMNLEFLIHSFQSFLVPV